eukprot:SAG11_NODE_627_length_8087_cov_3.567852_2_plen_214_part_00
MRCTSGAPHAATACIALALLLALRACLSGAWDRALPLVERQPLSPSSPHGAAPSPLLPPLPLHSPLGESSGAPVREAMLVSLSYPPSPNTPGGRRARTFELIRRVSGYYAGGSGTLRGKRCSTGCRTGVSPKHCDPRWSKLAVNCFINVTAGLSGLDTTSVRTLPSAVPLAASMATECINVAQAQGIEVEPVMGLGANLCGCNACSSRTLACV